MLRLAEPARLRYADRLFRFCIDHPAMGQPLPAIPAKRYFTIGEVAQLCNVKPHVLRYWEQEFTQLRPIKRRGNRRYYQHHEVRMVRRIRELLYDQGFTISGARNRMQELAQAASNTPAPDTTPPRKGPTRTSPTPRSTRTQCAKSYSQSARCYH